MKKLAKKPTLNDLEEILGTKERVLFYLAWLKHNRNATRAYKELHPKANDHSARVLGSKTLAGIDIKTVAAAYNLNHERYMEMIDRGLEATKPVSALITSKDADSKDMDFIEVPDHQTQLKYHDKLGKIIGVETNQPTQQINIGIQNVIDDQRKKYEI